MSPTSGGRPFDTQISKKLLEAAKTMMEERGFSELSVDSITSAANTTAPAFYRRYANLAELAVTVIIERFGDVTVGDSGDLEADLRIFQQHEVEVFNSPLVRHNLPALFDMARTNEAIRDLYVNKLVRPRRDRLREVFATARDRGDLPAGGDDEYACELLTGPLLSRLLVPLGLPIDEAFIERTVASAVRELRSA